jgi:predicted DCC family thiol-disulfide oxidoreductase YuxK
VNDAAPILLFDGVCNVCNASVRFVVAHERLPAMKFASLQSELGRRLVAEHGLSGDIDTVVFIQGHRVLVRSSAAVAVLRHLGGAWRILAALLWLVPRPLRNVGYDVFAHFRYRLFGRRDECMVPTAELRARFLG